MSLLHSLPYKEYKTALTLSVQECERIARLAGLKISFNTDKPGDQLVKALDRIGYSYDRYTKLINSQHNDTIPAYYRPQAKVAIMIANERYTHLANLATPVCDCELLSGILTTLGFFVLTINNSTSLQLKKTLRSVLEMIPEDSYCFIFYGGHGCQLSNTQCMLSIDCPTEDIGLQHCVTENYVLRELERRKPELVVLIMDMCRVYLDQVTNPKIYASMPTIEEYSIHKNLLISYSAQSSQSAYEVLQIECTTSMVLENDVTYELKTSDLDKIIPGSSQYAQVLSERLAETLNISSILDKVHADVEKSMKKQRPIKVQCGMDKRCLHDPVIGDIETLKTKIHHYLQKNEELNCTFHYQRTDTCF